MGRFTARFSDQELLAIVKEVATAASPEEPMSVSQRTYNDARAAAGRADTPRADKITKQIGCSWAEVLRLAIEVNNPTQVIGVRKGSKSRVPTTKAKISTALRRVAKSLDTDALNPADYDAERDRIVERDADSYLHGGQQEAALPTSSAIVAAAGSWEQALVIADLKTKGRQIAPAYPTEQAFEDFISDFGVAPSYKWLKKYQRRRGLAIADKPAKPYEDWAKEMLASGGHDDLTPPKSGQRPPADLDTRTITPAPEGYRPTEREGRYTLEECEVAIEKAVELARPKRLTQDIYQRLSKSHGLPAYNAILQACKREDESLTWGKLRDRVVASHSHKPRSQGRRPKRDR